jgi:hypothetical protein
MLMKTKSVDFHHVEDKHGAIHGRLLNWALWLRPHTVGSITPMFRQAKSNAWQWHTPELRETCDTLDAMRLEKAMRYLPKKNRAAIKWCYIERKEPFKMRKVLGVTDQGLFDLVSDGRTMLCNLSDGR